jgi:hypothetical protein
MVGGYVLRYALEHPGIENVTAVVRRSLGISHGAAEGPNLEKQEIRTMVQSLHAPRTDPAKGRI